ncbi:FAD-dependent oxidoreductase [Christensenellaceae bacterium OttesenSCG-928-K19]|nr:FAD-dependent oxidoreductase [Christensenellaceae bacterium OttesenSCG-928-K19]
MVKTVIVGSGAAGMEAANTLYNAGETDFLVLEKLDYIGGRIHTYRKDGYCIDAAAQLVHPGYKMARKVIGELGHSDDLLRSNMLGLRMYDETQKKRVFIKPDPERPPQENAATMQWIGAMGPDNVKAFMDWARERCADGKMYEGEVTWGLDVDNVVFADYVEEHFGKEVLERFAQPIISSVSLTYPERMSTLYGLQILWTVLVGDVDLMRDGLDVIIQKMLEKFGDKCRTNAEVTEIMIKDGKTTGVKLKDGEVIECENVICAAEAPNALKMLPDAPEVMKTALANIKYSQVFTVLIFTPEPEIDLMKFGTGTMFNRRANKPFATVSMRLGSKVPFMVPPGKMNTSMFLFDEVADELWDKSDQEVMDYIEKELRGVFDWYPEIEGFYIERFPYGNWRMSPGAATRMNDFRLNHYQDVPGLYLAGDYLFTSSYESALYTGERVANTLMQGKTQLV